MGSLSWLFVGREKQNIFTVGKTETLEGNKLRDKTENVENYMDFTLASWGERERLLLSCCLRLTLPVHLVEYLEGRALTF